MLLGRLAQVHEQTWDVRLWPSATPTKLVEDGRDYRRAGTVARVDRQFVLLDRTPAGADVLGPRSAYVPTVLTLRTPKGLTSYSLMGGP